MEELEFVKDRIQEINNSGVKASIMEVCGSHTAAISKFGIRGVLNKNIKLISGPGCPVCVTPDEVIDYIYDCSLEKDVIIATYGDMIRVPGSNTSHTLEAASAKGADVRVIYSSMDALKIAAENPNKKLIFLGIGFETTTPATAISIIEAEKNNINNFYVLSAHKRMEPVMRMLLEDSEINIDGFLCPGHVAAIIGTKSFQFLNEYGCAGVISGFEMKDIVESIYILINMIRTKNKGLVNSYKSVVRYEGNLRAMTYINEVFKIKDDLWRGMGLIQKSGYRIREKYRRHDIENIFQRTHKSDNKNILCRCGDVLKGKIQPCDCKLFHKKCTLETPMGPCMVSSEGSCAIYYKFNNYLESELNGRNNFYVIR